ncbi:MAG: hypothetical protein C4567_08805 [Deltaproteobacteria bacterium]|nr:MAG: hypothetical protein C4567_08805 [Deltaproteobacteria bacterium]
MSELRVTGCGLEVRDQGGAGLVINNSVISESHQRIMRRDVVEDRGCGVWVKGWEPQITRNPQLVRNSQLATHKIDAPRGK